MNPFKVVITGPESTGKSILTRELARCFHSLYVPEYARIYVEHLKRPYTFEDVEHIARKQFSLDREYSIRAKGMLFFDTYFIVTRIWFMRKYGCLPGWFEEEIKSRTVDYYLLCEPDIPWKEDHVRENGGRARKELFDEYEQAIRKSGVPYARIRGRGEERLHCGEKSIKEFFAFRKDRGETNRAP